MKREDYIKMREANSGEIMYEYYKENFDSEKHKPFLKIEEFFEAIEKYPLLQQAFNIATEYYDVKFNVLKCPLVDKTLFI